MTPGPPLALAAGTELRPVPGEAEAFEVGRGDVWFRLDEAAALVLTLFDGRRDEGAVRAEALRRRLPVSAASVRRLAEELAAHGLLTPVASLPLAAVPGGRVVCSQCGYCCHLTIGPLDEDEVARLTALDWASAGLAPPAATVRRDGGTGDAYLAKGAGDTCVFFDDDGLCRIHKVFGAAAKPDACRLFPLVPVYRAGEVRVGVTHECRGLWRAADHGQDAGRAAADLDAVVRRSLRGYPVLPEIDPGRRMWHAVAAEHPGPDAALRALAEVVTPGMDDGGIGVAELLAELERLAAESRDHAPTRFLAAEEEELRAALRALRGRAAPRWPLPGALLLGHLRSQVFLGEPMGRLGAASGVAVLALIVAASRALARGPTDRDEAEALGRAVGGLRCVDRVATIPGAGARLVREAVDLATRGGQPPSPSTTS